MTKHELEGKLYLEPQTTIYKWLFQWKDSKSLYRKWLFHQTSIYKWLALGFQVPLILKTAFQIPRHPKVV